MYIGVYKLVPLHSNNNSCIRCLGGLLLRRWFVEWWTWDLSQRPLATSSCAGEKVLHVPILRRFCLHLRYNPFWAVGEYHIGASLYLGVNELSQVREHVWTHSIRVARLPGNNARGKLCYKSVRVKPGLLKQILWVFRHTCYVCQVPMGCRGLWTGGG